MKANSPNAMHNPVAILHTESDDLALRAVVSAAMAFGDVWSPLPTGTRGAPQAGQARRSTVWVSAWATTLQNGQV